MRIFHPRRICALLTVFALFPFSGIAGAQARPYELTDVLQLVQAGLPSSSIVARVKKSCIDFKITSDVERVLRGANADSELIAGLRGSCYRGGEAAATVTKSSAKRKTAIEPPITSDETLQPPTRDGSVSSDGRQYPDVPMSRTPPFEDSQAWYSTKSGCTTQGFGFARSTIGGCDAWVATPLPDRARLELTWDKRPGEDWGTFSVSVGDQKSNVFLTYYRDGTYSTGRSRGDSVSLEKTWIHGAPGSHQHVVIAAQLQGRLLDLSINGVLVATDSVKSGAGRSFGIWASVQQGGTAQFSDVELGSPSGMLVSRQTIPILDEHYTDDPGGFAEILEEIVGDDTQCSYTKSDGLRIENRQGASTCMIEVGPELNEHVRIETSLTRESGPADSYQGVLFGVKVNEDFTGGRFVTNGIKPGALVFAVNGSGLYTLQSYTDAGWTPLIPWTPSSKLMKGPSASNKLTVVIEGRRATLFANGVQLNAYSSATPITGYPGILMSSAASGVPVTVRIPFIRIFPGN